MTKRKFSKGEINGILFSNIQNREHLKIRRIGFFKEILKYFLRRKTNRNSEKQTKGESNEAAIIFLSHSGFFNLEKIGYKLIKYKTGIGSNDLHIDLEAEENMLNIAFISPNLLIQSYFIEQAYKAICRKLEPFNVVALICNYPEFITNLLGLYLREREGVVVTMQHGIYMTQYYKPLYFEKYIANMNFVWGEVYKECYEQNGIKSDNIAIASPPFKLITLNKPFDMPNPIFLGQQLYKVVPGIKTQYNEAVRALINYYSKLGIKLTYKPHPREDIKISLTEENIKDLMFETKMSVDDKFFNQFTHAYSVNSTSLIRALCNGVMCFQVFLDMSMVNEDFSLHTSVGKLAIKDIAAHSLEHTNASYISNRFLNMKTEPQVYNSELLNKIVLTSCMKGFERKDIL